jgi:hypothetical protein
MQQKGIKTEDEAALKQAFIDGYLTVDLSTKIRGIPERDSRREYLTIEELNLLVLTPCEKDVLKRAALFSALTGLRLSNSAENRGFPDSLSLRICRTRRGFTPSEKMD